MPLIQYACLPTARMEMFYSAMRYPDLAVLDFSMNGHALYNYGSLPWLSEQVVSRQSYSTHMTELDLSLIHISRAGSLPAGSPTPIGFAPLSIPYAIFCIIL